MTVWQEMTALHSSLAQYNSLFYLLFSLITFPPELNLRMETAKCKRVCERCVNEAMNSVKYKNRTDQFIDWCVIDLKKINKCYLLVF